MGLQSVKRHDGQRVQIRLGDVVVWVWAKRDREGNRMVVSIDAPAEVKVLREELVPPGQEYRRADV